MAAALALLPLGAMAEINIDFESNSGYKAVGLYDAWEKSPFRTGELKGNFAITANPDTTTSEITGNRPNPSAKVLGAQRSRFGSNFFGARIDLNEVLPISPTTQYVHVMIYKPYEGRTMLMGLGSRTERLKQNPHAEQFWSMAKNTILPGQWCDAVFPVRGASGVNIRSLVVIPDCESPHNRTEDFLFYVDNIVVNNDPQPRIVNEFYAINGDKGSTAMNRSDRYTTSIKFKVGSTTQSIAVKQNSNHKLYQDLTDKAFFAKPGDTVTPSVTWTGTWMHAYCFVDWNRDGNFTVTTTDNNVDSNSEIVAYNYYKGKNSKGASASENLGSSCGTLPSFTIPAGTQPGMYRIRYKIDWDDVTPNGHNEIANNGGIIADAMLCVYGPEVVLNDFQLNGEILAADRTKLSNHKVPADADFTILSAPEKGFHNGGVTVKCGYNLSQEQQRDKFGNSNYITFDIPAKNFSEEGTYTIPAKQMRANLLFNGLMIEDGKDDPTEATAYPINFPNDTKITRTDRRLNSFTLTTPDGATQVSMDDNSDNLVYNKKTDIVVTATPGATITPSVDYTGNAMHTYWYVDLNEDGQFSNTLNANGTPAGELLSYSHYSGKNSLGNDQAASIRPDVNNPFKIPSTTAPGLYRARFKIDWNNIDPAGQYGESNNIDDNGGYIVDFMIHVYGSNCPISTNATNATGNLATSPAGTEIAPTGFTTPRGQDLAIADSTTTNTPVSSIKIRSGYHFNLANGRQYGNIYWTEADLAKANNAFIIPAEMLDRPAKLIAEWGKTGGLQQVELDLNSAIHNLQGVRVNHPSTGLYIINGQKIIIK